jgi:apolipoprotein N-acyltransferase
MAMAENRRLWWTVAAAAGLLAGGALPPLGSPPLLWLALVPLWALSPAQGALWGAMAVLISHRWLLWLHPLDWVGVPLPLSLPLCLLLWLSIALLGAVLVGGWRWLVGRLGADRFAAALLASALWGLAEVLLAKGPLFWIGLGAAALPGDPALAGLAQLLGAGGLAMLQLLLGWGLWQGVLRRRWRGRWLLGWLLSVLALHGAGLQQLRSESRSALEGPRETVLVLQPAIPTREKFSWLQQRSLQRQLSAALTEAQQRGADLLVLPEGALALGQELPSPPALEVLSGGFRQQDLELRSSLLQFPAGATEAQAALDKHRLVPLGEWIPGSGLLGWAGLSAVGGVSPGEAPRLLPRADGALAVAICYELADGSSLSRASRDGAGWILASANLDPYPEQLQQQFRALAQLRAIETSRWLVSAANTGPSLVVSPDGQVLAQLPSGQAGTLLSTVSRRFGQTPYVRWGEWPLLLLVLGASASLAWSRVRQS